MGSRPGVVLALLIGSSVAHATSVTTLQDSGPGSLRAAVGQANSGATNSISIDVAGTIELAAALPIVNPSGTLTITGPGASQLTIQRAGTAANFPVFTFAGSVQMSGVTISGGAGDTGVGGGIDLLATGSLVLLDSTVSGNTAPAGSAIRAAGTLQIRRSTITGNIGIGAIYAAGGATILDSTIAGNTGTAIVALPPAGKTLSIDRSTISGNTELAGSGGLELQGGTASVRNATFSGNTGAMAGDFWVHDGGNLALLNVTAADSTPPALLSTAVVTLRNTLLAGAGTRCAAGANLPTSLGHNLASDSSCNLTGAGDKPAVDPMLGPLAANGGPTQTRALLRGSPAFDGGDATDLETVDQRGLARVQFTAPDIGAIEAVAPILTLQPMPVTILAGAPFTLNVTAQNPGSAVVLTYQWRKDGARIPDATSDSYGRVQAQTTDSGSYDVLVTNEGGSLASMAASVTVTDPGTGPGSDQPASGGGCCSSAGGGAGGAGVLALVVAAVLGHRRWPRAANQRHAG